MNPARALFAIIGLLLVLGGAYLLYFEADLDRWIPLGVLTAGMLIIIGLAVLSFASSAPRDRAVDAGPTVVQERVREVPVERTTTTTRDTRDTRDVHRREPVVHRTSRQERAEHRHARHH